MDKKIFTRRENQNVSDYPELLKFTDAIRHSYWIHTQYNFTTDIQNFYVDVNKVERDIIKKVMLAISTIEIKVKRFWGDLYKRIEIPEIDSVGATFAECHVDGTEVLTPSGWVDFKDIDVGDEVIQFHPDNRLSITKVKNKVDEKYTGEIIKFNKKTLDCAITPNHRIGYYSRNTGVFHEKTAGELNIHSDIMLPEAGKLEGELNKLSTLDKLKIAIQADGSLRHWRNSEGDRIIRGLSKNKHTYEITVKKERKKKRLLSIIEELNIKYREYDDQRGYLKIEVDLEPDINYKEFDWVTMNNKSYKWCNEFINEISEWDGYKLPNKKDCKIKFSTTSKSVADKVQVIGICAGYKCNINKYVDNRKDSYKDVYTVSFVDNRERVGTNIKKTIENYSGRIRCITVDSGFIITRYNDKTFISGNSEIRHRDAYKFLLEKLGLESEFENVGNIPAIKGREDYLEKYLSGAKVPDNRIFTKTILLFSLFIEHVSLFSQFLIMLSFNKEKNMFQGVSNVVEATSIEENIHGLFGETLINIIKSQYPEWFDDEMISIVEGACSKAYQAEMEILDWIFEKGELDFLSKKTIDHFIRNRFNNSLRNIGYEPFFVVDEKELEKTEWFDLQLNSSKEDDFFYKHSVNYNKKSISVTQLDLF